MTDNSSSPVWLGITNVAVLRGAGTGGTDLVASNTGTLFLPQTPETFTHDADGNLTRDGRWTNFWDAENRLIRTESLGVETVRTSTFDIRNSKVRQDWSHLPDGRWSQRIIHSWTDNDWVPKATNRFLWDGQVLLAVLNGSNQPEQTYLRGLDLSGSLQGAGGVGGLLAVNLGASGTHFACNDGNGNVAALLTANSSSVTATYEYDPFGNTLRATGPAADANSLRFSTQFADDVTRRVKYLYRDYDAGVGRWLSRDPIEENGGVHLQGFTQNDPVNQYDNLGLTIRGTTVTQLTPLAAGYHGSFEYQTPGSGSLSYVEIMSSASVPGNYSQPGGAVNSAVISTRTALHAWFRGNTEFRVISSSPPRPRDSWALQYSFHYIGDWKIYGCCPRGRLYIDFRINSNYSQLSTGFPGGPISSGGVSADLANGIGGKNGVQTSLANPNRAVSGRLSLPFPAGELELRVALGASWVERAFGGGISGSATVFARASCH